MRSRLGTILKNRKITQKEFSEISKVGVDVISKLCRGYYDKVSVYHLYKISVSLGISAEFLIRNTDKIQYLNSDYTVKEIDLRLFYDIFGFNSSISKFIDYCKENNTTIDNQFLFKYV